MSKEGLIKRLDDLTSFIVKHRDKHTCQRCGNRVSGYYCQWAHIVTRGNKTLRWDLWNSLVLCMECHHWWHHNISKAKAWFKSKFPERDEYLQSEKNKVDHITESYLEERYKQLLPYKKGYL